MKNTKNMIIDTEKLQIKDKDKYYEPISNLIYINNVNVKNIYFLNELNLGGITYTANSNDVTLIIKFKDYTLCTIEEINIVLRNEKVEKIEIPFDVSDINITSNRKNSGTILTKVSVQSTTLNKTYYIDEFVGLIKIDKSKYTKEDVKDGILDLTDLNKYSNLDSSYLDVNTLIINKKDINNSKFKNAFNRKLNVKTLKIIDGNDMKLNPVKEIEINGILSIYKDYLVNESKNKLIYLDKNKQIKILDKEELLNNENIENVDFLISNDIQLVIIKYKNKEFKVLDKDIEYNIDSLFNKFLLLNIYRYDFYGKEIKELTNYIKNNDYYNIFNTGIIDNNLLFIIYKDYVEFINYFLGLKKIGFTDEALFYLLKKKYENIINPKSDNLLDKNKITKEEIEIFNMLGEKEVKKKLKK